MTMRERCRPTSLAFYFPDSSAITRDNERLFLAKVALPNGTHKTTYRNRLDDVNEWLLEFLPRDHRLTLMDLAMSSGVTTVEWSDHLHMHGVIHNIVATDVILDAWLTSWGTGIALLTHHADVTRPLLLEIGPLRMPPFSKRRLARLVRPVLVPLLRAAGSASYRLVCMPAMTRPSPRRWICRPVRLVTPELLVRSDIDVMEADLTSGVGHSAFDLIRAANLVNRGYFTDETLISMISEIGGHLREGGMLLVCRTADDGTNRATLFARSGACLKAHASINGGSDVADLVLAAAL